MEFNGVTASIVFIMKAVESIPCDLKGQMVAFDNDGNVISDPLKTPWPMPWVTEEIEKLVAGKNEMPVKDRFKVYNPEEPDQFVFVEVQRF